MLAYCKGKEISRLLEFENICDIAAPQPRWTKGKLKKQKRKYAQFNPFFANSGV